MAAENQEFSQDERRVQAKNTLVNSFHIIRKLDPDQPLKDFGFWHMRKESLGLEDITNMISHEGVGERELAYLSEVLLVGMMIDESASTIKGIRFTRNTFVPKILFNLMHPHNMVEMARKLYDYSAFFEDTLEGAPRMDQLAKMQISQTNPPTILDRNKKEIALLFEGADEVRELHPAILFHYLLTHTPEQVADVVEAKFPSKGDYKDLPLLKAKILHMQEVVAAFMHTGNTGVFSQNIREKSPALWVLSVLASGLQPETVRDIYLQEGLSDRVVHQACEGLITYYTLEHEELLTELDDHGIEALGHVTHTRAQDKAKIFEELSHVKKQDSSDNFWDDNTFIALRTNLRTKQGVNIFTIGKIGDLQVDITASTPFCIDVMFLDEKGHGAMVQISRDGTIYGISPEQVVDADKWIPAVMNVLKAYTYTVAPRLKPKETPKVNEAPLRRQPVFEKSQHPRFPQVSGTKRKHTMQEKSEIGDTNGLSNVQLEPIPIRKHQINTDFPRFQRNREKLVGVNSSLRKDIENTIQAIRQGKLRIQRLNTNAAGGEVTAYKVKFKNNGVPYRLILVEGETNDMLYCFDVAIRSDYYDENFQRELRKFHAQIIEKKRDIERQEKQRR